MVTEGRVVDCTSVTIGRAVSKSVVAAKYPNSCKQHTINCMGGVNADFEIIELLYFV